MTTPGPGAPLYWRAEQERARREWTKQRLAQEASMSRVTYDRLADQPNPPHVRTVKRLCEAVGIPLVEGLRLVGIIPGSSS